MKRYVGDGILVQEAFRWPDGLIRPTKILLSRDRQRVWGSDPLSREDTATLILGDLTLSVERRLGWWSLRLYILRILRIKVSIKEAL